MMARLLFNHRLLRPSSSSSSVSISFSSFLVDLSGVLCCGFHFHGIFSRPKRVCGRITQQQQIRDGLEGWTSFITKICHPNLIHEFQANHRRRWSYSRIAKQWQGCWSWLLLSIRVLAAGAKDDSWLLRSFRVLAANVEGGTLNGLACMKTLLNESQAH